MFNLIFNSFSLDLCTPMSKVINKKFRFLRWLNTGMIMPLSALAIISSILLYLFLLVAIR